jgi:hypothetical protein
VGAADPEHHRQDDDYGGDGEDAPRNFTVGLQGKIFWRSVDVFGAGKLQVGKFLNLCGGWRFRGGLVGLDYAALFGGRQRFRGAWLRGRRRFPNFLRIDLRLAEACEVVGNGFLGVQT